MFDDFFDTDFMPRTRSAQWDACLSKNSTAPAVNVKESEKAYTMVIGLPLHSSKNLQLQASRKNNAA